MVNLTFRMCPSGVFIIPVSAMVQLIEIFSSGKLFDLLFQSGAFHQVGQQHISKIVHHIRINKIDAVLAAAQFQCFHVGLHIFLIRGFYFITSHANFFTGFHINKNIGAVII